MIDGWMDGWTDNFYPWFLYLCQPAYLPPLWLSWNGQSLRSFCIAGFARGSVETVEVAAGLVSLPCKPLRQDPVRGKPVLRKAKPEVRDR